MIRCPLCHASKSYVLHAISREHRANRRPSSIKHYGYYRRRQCNDCGELFSTIEIHFDIFRALTDCFKDMKRVLRLTAAMEQLTKTAAEVAAEDEPWPERAPVPDASRMRK